MSSYLNNFKAIKITENVYWVGVIDWELSNFHGYQTTHGSTYNAYLILGEKPILIDTVKKPFFEEMWARIASVIDPLKIKYIVSNHSEMDHSGSLPEMIERIKPEKVIASVTGVQTLKEHFHFDYEITEVKTGDSLTLGNTTLTFIETKMLHWPESMFTYFPKEKILFSQDGFGMHLADNLLFAEQYDPCLIEYEAKKYFANILLPYSPLVTKLLNYLQTLNLEIDTIATAHGPIWRGKNNVAKAISNWTKWALQAYAPTAIILYESMWGSTALMAKTIAEGLTQNGIKTKLTPATKVHRSDVITELMDAGALLVGSSTLNQQVLPEIADILCYLKGLKPQNLVGQVFGSYGWGAESIKILEKDLQEMKVEPVSESIKVKYVPTGEDLEKCRNLGIEVAKALQKHLAK
jgi:flavorubredoxin